MKGNRIIAIDIKTIFCLSLSEMQSTAPDLEINKNPSGQRDFILIVFHTTGTTVFAQKLITQI